MRDEHTSRLQAQAKLQQTYEAIPIGLFTLDSEGAFLSANPTWGVAYFITAGGGFGVSTMPCIDCTLTGGTNVKPSFW